MYVNVVEAGCVGYVYTVRGVKKYYDSRICSGKKLSE